MKLVITQPVVFPRVYLLNRLRWCDYYVLMNHAQFNRKVGMGQLAVMADQRERIIGVPVESTGQRQSCAEKRIAADDRWWKETERQLKQWYGFYSDIDSKIGQLKELVFESRTVAELGGNSLRFAADLLGDDVNRIQPDSEDWKVEGDPSGWLLNICDKFNATQYMCGAAGASQYLEFPRFEESEIEVVMQDWDAPADGNLSWVHYWLADKLDELHERL